MTIDDVKELTSQEDSSSLASRSSKHSCARIPIPKSLTGGLLVVLEHFAKHQRLVEGNTKYVAEV